MLKSVNISTESLFDFLIIFILLVAFYLCLFPPAPFRTQNDELKSSIQKALVNPELITQPYYATIYAKYKTPALREKTFVEYFMDHGPKVDEIGSFGSAVLAKFAEEDQQEYMEVADHLLLNLETKMEGKNRYPNWEPHWRDFAVPLTRFYASYLFLGTSKQLLNICSKRIPEIIPEINKARNHELQAAELARVAIPRLMFLYLNNRETYRKELKSEAFKSLVPIFNITQNLTEKVEDGIYLDGTVIWKGAANFMNLVSLNEFYGQVYEVLGLKTDLDEYVRSLLSSILHPELKIVPFGLFGTDPKLSGPEIWTYVPEFKPERSLGVRIFPVCGLGVFKASKFVFHVRVQRPKIAAYVSDHRNFEFAQGWMQVRKLFLIGSKFSSWNAKELSTQPGVISTEKSRTRLQDLKVGATAEPKNFYAESVESFLGYLNEGNNLLMFWRNKYKFKELFGDLQVNEFGTCTENGLTMKYFIEIGTEQQVKIQLKDSELRGVKFEPVQDSVKFTPRNKGITWRQVFDTKQEPKDLDCDEKGNMSFMFKGYRWTIDVIDKEFYTVSRGTSIVSAGSSRGNINDKFMYKENNYKRDPKTLMYNIVN